MAQAALIASDRGRPSREGPIEIPFLVTRLSHHASCAGPLVGDGGLCARTLEVLSYFILSICGACMLLFILVISVNVTAFQDANMLLLYKAPISPVGKSVHSVGAGR